MSTTFVTQLSAPLNAMNFVVWDGPRPKQLRKETQVFRRFGAQNAGAVVLPVRAEPFSAVAHQIYTSQLAAESAVVAWLALIGTKVQITWETIAMHTAYDTEYLVTDLSTDGWREIHSFQNYGGTYIAPAWEIVWQIDLLPLLIPT